MRRGIATLLTAAISCTLGIGAAGAAESLPKVQTLLAPFKWIAGGKTIESDKPFYNGTEWVPSSMNYKGTTYIPIRLAAESLGYTLYWDGKAGTATLIDSESEDDPVSDIPGIVPSAPVTSDTSVLRDAELRSLQGAGGKKVAALQKGSKVVVLEESGDGWIRVVAGGKIGWLSAKATDYIPLADRPKWEQAADSILGIGLKYLGTEYEFDAKLGQTITFDCSSFVNYLYELHGYDMPRNSRQQSSVGRMISFDELRKGDLVFFTTPKRSGKTGAERIGHVGIYAGNNKLLYTYRKGIGVTVTIMDENWQKRFVKAQRVISG
jgi:hypothetical protein